MMFVTSAALIAVLAAPTLEIPCGEALSPLVNRLPGPAALQLAEGCVYPAPLQIKEDVVVEIIGREGTVLRGGVSVEGARAVTLKDLRVEGRVSLVARRVDALTLDNVTLGGAEGAHLFDSGSVFFREVRIDSPHSALWLERVVSFYLIRGEVPEARRPLISHDTQRLAVIDSALRADPLSRVEAAIVIEGGEARFEGSRLEFLKHRRGVGVLLDLNTRAHLEGNRLITQGTGLRNRGALKLGCNQFSVGAMRMVEGDYERACARDIPADSLRPRYALNARR